MSTVAVSGYFDPLHPGHIEYFYEAKKIAGEDGDLVVIVNSDEQARAKRQRTGGPPAIFDERDRMALVYSIGFVTEAFLSIDKDESVKESLSVIKPDFFANGGDRWADEIPEKEVCDSLGIKIVEGLGKKIHSSSKIRSQIYNPNRTDYSRHCSYHDRKRVKKSWGWEDWVWNKEYCGKILYLYEGTNSSWHHHYSKDEVLYLVSGEVGILYSPGNSKEGAKYAQLSPGDSFHVSPGLRHQIKAIKSSYIAEFSTEHFDEDSIRL